MDPYLTVAVNLNLVPGVSHSGLVHEEEGVRITVHGGHPRAVAAMILQCLPPGTPTVGGAAVQVGEHMVRFDHEEPDVGQPEAPVTPLPLVNPEGVHLPMGVSLPRDRAARGWHRGWKILMLTAILLLGGNLVYLFLRDLGAVS